MLGLKISRLVTTVGKTAAKVTAVDTAMLVFSRKMPELTDLPKFIPFDEAAEIAGVSRHTIKRWVAEKKLVARYPKQNRGEVNVESLFRHVMPGLERGKQ